MNTNTKLNERLVKFVIKATLITKQVLDKYPADENTLEKRKQQLDKYTLEFLEDVTELIAKGDATQIYQV